MSENSLRISVLIKKLLLMNRGGDAKKHHAKYDAKYEDQVEGETPAKKSARKRIRQELVQVLNVDAGAGPR